MVRFEVSTPKEPLELSTRAIASAFEWNIRTLDIYAAVTGEPVEKLTAEEFTISPALGNQPNQTYTITLNESWVNRFGGQTVNFYIVANDASSTNGPHTSLAANSGDEDTFRNSLANELAVGGNGRLEPIVPPNGSTQNLLFSTDIQNVLISGRVQQPAQLKRREARFDIQNRTYAPGTQQLIITGIQVINAPNTGLIFGAGDAATPGVERVDNMVFPGLDPSAYTETAPGSDMPGDLATSVFYLYPTTLALASSSTPADRTQIIVTGTYKGNTVEYPVNVPVDTPIQANFRYILKIDASTASIDLIGMEYDEGGTYTTGPGLNSVRAALTPETATIVGTGTYTTRDANVFASVQPQTATSMQFTALSEAGTTYNLQLIETGMVNVAPATRTTRATGERLDTRAGENPIGVSRIRTSEAPGMKEVYTVTIPAGIGFVDALLTIDSGKDKAGVELGVDSIMIRRFWGGDATALLYVGTDGALNAGSWDEIVAQRMQERMPLFKFGGVVGSFLKGPNATAWVAANIGFNPSNAAPTTYATIPSYVAADWTAGIRNVSSPEWHNAANIRAGKGDPCKLVGLNPATIKAMTDAQLNAYDSGWRLPTVMENLSFAGGPADAFPIDEMRAGEFWKSWKVGGINYNYIDTNLVHPVTETTANENHKYDYIKYWVPPQGPGTNIAPPMYAVPMEDSYATALSQPMPGLGFYNGNTGVSTSFSYWSYWISSNPGNNASYYTFTIPRVWPVDSNAIYGAANPIRCVSSGPDVTQYQPKPVPMADPKVNGVTWAKSNVEMPKRLATMPGDVGYYYQWGQNVPWSNSDPLDNMSGGSDTWTTVADNTDLDPWPAATDPCPTGYRMPVKADFEALIDQTKVARNLLRAGQTSPMTGIAYGNRPGYEFVDYASRDAVFFPAAMGRANTTGALTDNPDVGNGRYWAGSAASATTADRLTFSPTGVNADNVSASLNTALAVRCVKVIPDPEHVLVAGVKWAKRNVQLVGSFSPNVVDTGYYYQFGSLTAWYSGTTAIDGSGKTWSGTTAQTTAAWPTEAGPCPPGYVMPSIEDFDALADPANTTFVWVPVGTASTATGVTYGGRAGAEFIDKVTGNVVFLAAGGVKESIAAGTISNVDTNGHYQTVGADPSVNTNAYRYSFSSSSSATNLDTSAKSTGRTVRCKVK
jgi:uncharacterized protein (TIGR02145 family)